MSTWRPRTVWRAAFLFLLPLASVLWAQPAAEKPGIPAGTFPIVAFSAGNPTDTNFAEVKSYGFDYVHRYRLTCRDEAQVKAYLDTAQRQKLKVMMDMSGFVDPRHSPAKDMPPEKRLEALRAAVRKWKDHPAVGFWYIYDEPSPKVMTPAQLKEIHDAVKAECPDIPTAYAQHWAEKWWEYVPSVDIVMPDFYPVRDQKFPEGNRLALMTEFFGNVAKTGERSMPIVQCFGFPRLPNTAEVRYMLFSSLTQGIEGMAFWSYWYGRFRPFKVPGKDGKPTLGQLDKQYMKKVYSPVLLELKAFVADVMPAAKAEYVKGAKNWLLDDKKVVHALWQREGTTYAVVISNQAEERNLDIPFDCGLPSAALTPLGSTRKSTAAIRGGHLVIPGMKPWEVFVWKLVPGE